MKTEAFFSGIKAAHEAVSKLKQSGFDKAFVDINDNYFHSEIENSTSLSGLVMESGTNDIDKRTAPLAAANPAVSGMGKMEEIADINYKVVVETNKENEDKLKQLLKDMGGDLNNPNVDQRQVLSHTEPEDILEHALRNMMKRL